MKNQEKKQPEANQKEKNENGNVLVIVLIAIILLAALTFTFMKGDSSSNTSTLSKGEAKIAASNILKYAKSVENAVRKLQLVNQCSENDISFENSVESGYTNVNAPSECWVFGGQGGGLSWQSPEDGDEWLYSGAIGLEYYTGAYAGETELTIILPRLSHETCFQINKLVGINHDQDDIPHGLNNIAEVKFTGTYVHSDSIGGASAATIFRTAIQNGEKAFCFQEATGDEDRFFIKTIINRE